jgi:type VI secretion system protein ImpL
MKIWPEDATFLTILLVIVIFFTVGLIALAILLVVKSRKKEMSAGGEKPEKRAKWFLAPVPGMTDSFRKAMKRLRQKLPGWSSRYNVPWYVLVGEPGSGKSAIADALSGLNTEMVDPSHPQYAPRWLLLDQAVLIDLPGRSFLSEAVPASIPEGESTLEMRDPELATDRRAWKSFLRLAARFRPRQPLNGIILTIAATELLEASDDVEHPDRLARIAALAQRLDDIQRLLGLTLPVDVLITKCDAVEGFSSFSRGLFEEAVTKQSGTNGHPSGELSDNILGWSNPYLLNSAFTPEWVDEAFDATVEILFRRQLEMLAESKTVAAADGVFLFPFELLSLRAPLRFVLDRVLRTTAYYSSHHLRGIYFCGRETPEPLHSELAASPAKNLGSRWVNPAKPGQPVLYVRHLFGSKVFPERYLATPVARGFFSTNRSVMAAQILSGVLALLLAGSTINAWSRIGSLEKNRIEPVLLSLATSLDSVAVSSGDNIAPAVEVVNALGAIHERQYYSLAMPISYLDLGGLHRDLKEALEHSFEIVILRSCKFSLEDKINNLINSSPNASSQAMQPSSTYPLGDTWGLDPAYGELNRYLSDVEALQINIQRYRFVSAAGSGSFTQLNELLRYLHGRSFPDTSRFAQDETYNKLLLDAVWQPLEIPPDFDAETAAAAKRQIDGFYGSWFDSNPLRAEVSWLAGKDGLESLLAAGARPSNQQLRAIASHAEAMDVQLRGGTYDWLAMAFNRQAYPALGPKLDQMPFADTQFVNDVSREGTQRLATLKTSLTTTPEVLDFQEGKVRLAGQVQALASVLDALFGYAFMTDDYEGAYASGACRLIPAGTIWSSDILTQASALSAMHNQAESDLLPSLPGEYQKPVQALVDRRVVTALSSLLQNAAVPNPNEGDKQAALETELQNFTQSIDKLEQMDNSLIALRAIEESFCLKRSLTRQANSMLSRINQQLPALYGHTAPSGNLGYNLPVSLWLYGVPSADDLQAYLAAEHQRIEALSAQAAPLVKVLHAAGGHSEELNRWQDISQDVADFEAQKPDNPIQSLEFFISTGLNKITPDADCKAILSGRSTDIFLNVRARLASLAVEHCHELAVARFNAIAADFNRRLSGRFPFSQFLDNRPGAEADLSDILSFYQTVDILSPGLAAVLPGVTQNPDEVAAFLQNILAARPLVTASAKDLAPAMSLSVQFRTNRSRETFGNRIAQWNLQVNQQSLKSPPGPGDGPLPVWHMGDPITLSLRYANNSPEVPAVSNPSPAASVQGMMVTYQYSDAWSLFSMLRDHPPGPSDPRDQYAITIPNQFSATPNSSAQPLKTVVYIQVDALPVGAKPAGQTIPMPSFPYQAPLATLKPASGD